MVTSYTSGFEKGHGSAVKTSLKKDRRTWILGLAVLGALGFFFFRGGVALPVGMNVQEVKLQKIKCGESAAI